MGRVQSGLGRLLACVCRVPEELSGSGQLSSNACRSRDGVEVGRGGGIRGGEEWVVVVAVVVVVVVVENWWWEIQSQSQLWLE